MNLHTKSKLDTVSVYDLMGNNFFIPDYQRGYRWTPSEVSKLLYDLDLFFENNNDGTSFYCLQPLVVFYNELENAWEVIDGQQRLTTLYLILSQKRERLKEDNPSMELFSLKYQSRPDSEEFLTQLDECRKNENIDYYHICNAVNVIKSFLKECSLGSGRFVDSIVNVNNNSNRPSVKFIWYNVTEEIKTKSITPEQKFSDLNIGKISLTNAELIKAKFLLCVKDNSSEALRISSEWDNIEHSLQDNSLWAFIYGRDDGRYVTRIDFLFDLINEKSESETNEYFTFDRYVKLLESAKKSVKVLWKEITDKFYLIKGWYENFYFFHIIGYLRYKKVGIDEIERIYFLSDTKDNPDFYTKLRKIAVSEFENIEIQSLDYHNQGDKKRIYDILLLFNILSIFECKEKNLRFSFERFYNHSWDLEHVRSQTPKEMDGQGRLDWIVCVLEYFTGIDYYNTKYRDNIELYLDDIRKADMPAITFKGSGFESISAKTICEELTKLISTKGDITETPVYKVLSEAVFHQSKSFKYEDSICNLVLLDQGTNRGYQNAYFPVKRRWIFRREKEGVYVLPCTRNVFTKTYSKILFDLMNWTNDDAESYLNEILERIMQSGETQL